MKLNLKMTMNVLMMVASAFSMLTMTSVVSPSAKPLDSQLSVSFCPGHWGSCSRLDPSSVKLQQPSWFPRCGPETSEASSKGKKEGPLMEIPTLQRAFYGYIIAIVRLLYLEVLTKGTSFYAWIQGFRLRSVGCI